MNNLIQKKALNLYLTDWDRRFDYDEIIDAMKVHGDNTGSLIAPMLVVWQPFENYDLSYVADLIEDELEAIQQLIKDLT